MALEEMRLRQAAMMQVDIRVRQQWQWDRLVMSGWARLLLCSCQ